MGVLFLFHHQKSCGSLSQKADSVPISQSLKRIMGTVVLWFSKQVGGEKEEERVGFDGWMVWK